MLVGAAVDRPDFESWLGDLAASEVVGVASGDSDHLTGANGEMLRILGVKAERLAKGLAWRDIMPPDQLERVFHALRDVQTLGAIVLADVLRPTGERRPVVMALVASGRRPTGWVAVVVGLAVSGHSVAEPLLRKLLRMGQAIGDIELSGWSFARPDREGGRLESFPSVHAGGGSSPGMAVVARHVTEARALRDRLQATVDRQRTALVDLQHSLLPDVPSDVRTRVCARYSGAGTAVDLGGDWFDVLHTPDGRLALAVGDVTGHGLFAVGAMARASGAMRAYICDGYGPGEVLARLNRVVGDPSFSAYATATVVYLYEASGAIECAAAGHPAPLIRAAGGAVRAAVSTGGMMLGVCDHTTYATSTGTMAVGSRLLLFTDGLVEHRGADLDQGIERLRSAFAALPEEASPDDAVEFLLTSCLSFGPRRDDVCALLFGRT